MLCRFPRRSPTSRKGMPQELEDKFFGKEEYTFINVSATCAGAVAVQCVLRNKYFEVGRRGVHVHQRGK